MQGSGSEERKTAHEGLMVKLAAQYGNLTGSVQRLVCQRKWFTSIESAIGDETNRWCNI